MVIRGLGGSEETSPRLRRPQSDRQHRTKPPLDRYPDNPQRAKIEARFAGILEAFDRAKDN